MPGACAVLTATRSGTANSEYLTKLRNIMLALCCVLRSASTTPHSVEVGRAQVSSHASRGSLNAKHLCFSCCLPGMASTPASSTPGVRFTDCETVSHLM
jgi:hypothetical protein